MKEIFTKYPLPVSPSPQDVRSMSLLTADLADLLCEIITELQHDGVQRGIDWPRLSAAKDTAMEKRRQIIACCRSNVEVCSSRRDFEQWQDLSERALKSAVGSLEADPATPAEEGAWPLFECLRQTHDWRRELESYHRVTTIRYLLGTALRRGFGRRKPVSEREVQDALEWLLIGANLEYLREFDKSELCRHGYKPDFTIAELECAIELKLCKQRDGEKKVIDEVLIDCVAYKERWPNVLIAIYDAAGAFNDPDRVQRSFLSNFGVEVFVVKD